MPLLLVLLSSLFNVVSTYHDIYYDRNPDVHFIILFFGCVVHVGYIPWIGDLMKQSFEALEDLMKICFETLVGAV